MLHKSGIAFESHDTVRLSASEEMPQASMLRRMIRFDNKAERGAGVPLPSGRVSVFAARGDESLLLADSRMRDYARGRELSTDLHAGKDR